MPYIKSFAIEGLHDFFDYPNCAPESSPTDLVILYGDNGSGKTTVLNLIFHLLSSQPNRSHLTAISRIPFKLVRIALSNGTFISARRQDSAHSIPIIFSISLPDRKAVEYRFIPERIRERYFQEQLERELQKRSSLLKELKEKRQQSKDKNLELFLPNVIVKNSDEDSQKRYFAALQELGIVCYYMGADRRIKSDALEDRKVIARSTVEADKDDDVITRVRSQYLREAMFAASRYINRQVIVATNVGSKDTNDIFSELIRQIAQEQSEYQVSQKIESLGNSIEKLRQIQAKNEKFSKLGITPELRFDAIIPSILQAFQSNRELIARILKPYIDGLNARQKALEPLAEVIEVFLKILNTLLKYKKITFSPESGIQIHGMTRELLDADELSSGEQQLLIMFCYLLASNETPSIFMIDEPEISLNVKWQRELVDSMRRIMGASDSQLVVATHSIELLTQHSESVISLRPAFKSASGISHDGREENS